MKLKMSVKIGVATGKMATLTPSGDISGFFCFLFEILLQNIKTTPRGSSFKITLARKETFIAFLLGFPVRKIANL